MPDSYSSSKSISNRIAYGSVLSVVRAIVGAMSNFLLARWLGPGGFGDLAFLLATMLAVRSLIDFGTSQAFFTFYSERTRGYNLLWFYWGWVSIQLLLLLLLIKWLLPPTYLELFWPGQPRNLALLAMLAVFAQGTVWNALSQMAEAAKETILIQSVALCVSVIHLLLIVGLKGADSLSVTTVFSVVAFEWVSASIFVVLKYRHSVVSTICSSEKESVQSAAKEMLLYCLPLLPYTIASFAHDFLDRWMLQAWGGSEQQGIFATSLQLSAIFIVLITATMRVLWNEFAEAHHNTDIKKLGELYHSSAMGLFFFSALISCFLFSFSDVILAFTVGEAYASGALTLSIMLLYPMHQVLGQIVTTCFLATRLVLATSLFGIAFLVLGTAFTFILLSPDFYGAGMGANASLVIASKMLLIQFVQITCMQFYLSKKFSWRLNLVSQMRTVLILLVLGWCSSRVGGWLVGSLGAIPDMFLSGVLYMTCVMGILYARPEFVGTSEKGIRRTIAKMKSLINKDGAAPRPNDS